MKRTDLLNNITPHFYVILYEPNYKKMIPYDVMPYFISEYEETKKGKPKTLAEFKEFVKSKSLYMFWSRCQYEIIISGWPVRDTEEKWDVHRQIMNNIDIVTIILYNTVKTRKKLKELDDTSSIQAE